MHDLRQTFLIVDEGNSNIRTKLKRHTVAGHMLNKSRGVNKSFVPHPPVRTY